VNVDQLRENGMEDVRQRVRDLAGEGLTAQEIRARLATGLSENEREIVRLLASREVKRHATAADAPNGRFPRRIEPQLTVASLAELDDSIEAAGHADPARDTRDRQLTAAAIVGIGGFVMLVSITFDIVALAVVGFVVLFAGLAAALFADRSDQER
jgi:hypothetical protein